MNPKKIAAAAIIAGTLGFSALGPGVGMANAYPVSPSNVPSIPWQQDDGGWCLPWWCPWGGDDWGRGDWGRGDWGRGDWGGRGYWGGRGHGDR